MTPERVEQLNKVLEDLTKGFTLPKQEMLGILQHMFMTVVTVDQLEEQEADDLYKAVFRPMQERILKAVAERGRD